MGKQSGWVIAATEGTTIDGRTISRSWIEEMAETYSVTEYCALIWPEHSRSTWGSFQGKNWGTVDEVKAEKRAGKYRLLVKITANDYLLAANKDGQKLFLSIEIDPDFTGNAKCYLKGLAVTDSPASTGTTRLKFSAGTTEFDREYSHLEELKLSDFSEQTPSIDEQAKTLFTQLINLFSTKLKAEEEPNNAEEDNTMTKEQLEALMAKFGELDKKIDGIETKFSTLEATVNKFSASAQEEAPAEPAPEEAAPAAVTAEQFSALTESLKGVSEKLGNMETKFNELSQEAPGQEPEQSGGESVNLV